VTASEAANKMLRERGYVVFGRTAESTILKVGDVVDKLFSQNGDIPGPIVVIGITDYEDFKVQAEMSQISADAPPGARFYRATAE
jgi:hypothetical protein